MRMIYASGAIALFMAACGPMAEGTTAHKLTQMAVAKVGRSSSPETSPAPATAPAMTRANIDNSPVPLMLMTAQDLGGAAVVQLASKNKERETYISPDGIAVTMVGGIATATRGFSEDLFASNPVHTLKAIHSGGGISEKLIEYLDSNDRIKSVILKCEISKVENIKLKIVETVYDTVRFREHCVNEEYDHINYYWADKTGNIVQSQQWISFSVGYLVTQLL